MSEKTSRKIIIFLIVCIVAAASFFAVVLYEMDREMQSVLGEQTTETQTATVPEAQPQTEKPSETETSDESNTTKSETEAPTESTTETTAETTVEKTTEASETTGETAAPADKTTTERPTAKPAEKPAVKPTKPASQSGKRIVVDPTREPWNLVVVNSGREMPSGYKPKLSQIFSTGKYLDSRVTPHYEKMYNAAKKDGVTLTPYSAYRSYETQKNNFNNYANVNFISKGMSRAEAEKKTAAIVLPAGTSEHNLGIAVDICSVKSSFGNGPEYVWLMKNAHKYGFILRYTAEKQPITGIVSEPWHWRYVGVEYAEKIKNSGLCLEEYLDSVGIKY